VPGIIGGIINSFPDRPRRPNNDPTRPPRDTPPSRTPGTNGNPANPNNSRPPSTNVPGTTQPPRTTNSGQVVRRVPRRPTTTTPQEPVVR